MSKQIEKIKELIAKEREIGVGDIATISGRYYAMDRDKRWDRVKKAYDLIVNGEGEHFTNPVEAVKSSYEKDVTDEFIAPMVAVDGKVEKSELSVMALEMVKFGVNPDAGMDFWNLADALDFGHAIAVISAMNQEQKKYVTGYLATIMAADGEIADSEVTLWRLISTLANLPAMNIGEAITFWKNN